MILVSSVSKSLPPNFETPSEVRISISWPEILATVQSKVPPPRSYITKVPDNSFPD